MKKGILLACTLVCLGAYSLACAQTVITDWTVADPIPDGNAVGRADTQTIQGLVGEILSLRVNLNLTERGGPAFNGDLYVTLLHDTGFSVLLNRPGKTAGNVLGYGDSGLNVTFADEPGALDIHRYRFELSGSDTVPLASALTGTWGTDARAVDPDLVTQGDTRTATLASFTGLDPNGSWTLFVADTESGNQATLQSWGLELTLIPEPPSALAFGLVASLVGVWLCQRYGQTVR